MALVAVNPAAIGATLAREQAATQRGLATRAGESATKGAAGAGEDTEPKLILADKVLLVLFAVTADAAGFVIALSAFALGRVAELFSDILEWMGKLKNLIGTVAKIAGLGFEVLDWIFYGYAIILTAILTVVVAFVVVLFLKLKGFSWQEIISSVGGGGLVELILGFLPIWTLAAIRIIIKDARRGKEGVTHAL